MDNLLNLHDPGWSREGLQLCWETFNRRQKLPQFPAADCILKTLRGLFGWVEEAANCEQKIKQRVHSCLPGCIPWSCLEQPALREREHAVPCIHLPVPSGFTPPWRFRKENIARMGRMSFEILFRYRFDTCIKLAVLTHLVRSRKFLAQSSVLPVPVQQTHHKNKHQQVEKRSKKLYF